MQLRFRFSLVCTVICYTFLLILPRSAHSEPVLFITESVPPIVYIHNGKLKGYSIELVKLLWKNMNMPEHEIKIQPWPRSIKDFDSSTPTCLFPVAITEERKQNYRCVTTPIQFDIAILTHKRNEKLFGTPAHIKRARMCVPKAASILPLLRSHGYTDKNFDFGTTFPCSVKKFFKGRAPLIAGSIPNILYNYRLIGGDSSKLRVLKTVGNIPNGFMFNDAVPQKFIDDFQEAMNSFADSEEAKAIYKKEMRYYYPKL